MSRLANRLTRRGANARIGGSFLPNTLSGLQGWWRGDGITSPPADGAALVTWTDSSSAARNLTQATGANQPTYRTSGAFLPNGKPCVEFTAASATRVVSTSTTSNGDLTRFVVMRMKTRPSGGNTAAPFQAPSGHAIAIDQYGRFATAIDGAAWVIHSTGYSLLVTGQWYILTVTDTAGSHTTYVNGAQDAHTTVAHPTPTSTTVAAGASGSGGNPFDGYVAEVIDYNRVLTSTERGQVHTYLAGKYGITLPAGPYAIQSFDFDTGNLDQWLSGVGGLEAGDPSTESILSTTVRRGTSGYSHRTELANTPADLYNGQTWRTMLSKYDTQESGLNGPADFAYGFSFRYPTEGQQTALPQFNQFFELHARSPIYNVSSNLAIAPHSIRLTGGNLYYEMFTGAAVWNGSQWTGWSQYYADQLLISSVQLNTWYDVVFRIKCAEDNSGTVQVWARQAGNAFPGTPTLTINAPTMQYVPGGLDPNVPNKISMNDIDPDGYAGMFLQAGIYIGVFPTTVWPSGEPSQELILYLDEARRYNTAAEAMAAFPP